ncbi:MAG: HAD-IIB family hydrolase [Bradymonadaceae bacterium]|nr:HAD-IIB family hydrolase [Lujinxingiaceae bacterium]
MLPLVFLDLDGTIIGTDGGVSDAVWQAIEVAHAAGIILAACTGRACQGVAQQIAQRLAPHTAHVFHNGALVANADGHILQSHTLERAELARLVEHARTIGATIEFYTADAIYVEQLDWRCEHHAEVLQIELTRRDLDDVAQSEDVLRAHWIVAPEQLEAALALHLAGCQIGTASSPALPESVFASVTRAGVSKGSAARFVADALGVALEHTMAIGDSHGDLPVLEIVGHPRVMGDAPGELTRRFATLASISQDGVIEALREAMMWKKR